MVCIGFMARLKKIQIYLTWAWKFILELGNNMYDKSNLTSKVHLKLNMCMQWNRKDPGQDTEWTPETNISCLWTPDKNHSQRVKRPKLIEQESGNERKQIEENTHIWHQRLSLNRDSSYSLPPYVTTCYHVTGIPHVSQFLFTEEDHEMHTKT